jgi:hypothetical protein
VEREDITICNHRCYVEPKLNILYIGECMSDSDVVYLQYKTRFTINSHIVNSLWTEFEETAWSDPNLEDYCLSTITSPIVKRVIATIAVKAASIGQAQAYIEQTYPGTVSAFDLHYIGTVSAHEFQEYYEDTIDNLFAEHDNDNKAYEDTNVTYGASSALFVFDTKDILYNSSDVISNRRKVQSDKDSITILEKLINQHPEIDITVHPFLAVAVKEKLPLTPAQAAEAAKLFKVSPSILLSEHVDEDKLVALRSLL